jgi:hypothetical protein
MAEMDNVILEHLFHIRAAIDGVCNDIRGSDRLDRMEARIERIEHHLDLRGE